MAKKKTSTTKARSKPKTSDVNHMRRVMMGGKKIPPGRAGNQTGATLGAAKNALWRALVLSPETVDDIRDVYVPGKNDDKVMGENNLPIEFVRGALLLPKVTEEDQRAEEQPLPIPSGLMSILDAQCARHRRETGDDNPNVNEVRLFVLMSALMKSAESVSEGKMPGTELKFVGEKRAKKKTAKKAKTEGEK